MHRLSLQAAGNTWPVSVACLSFVHVQALLAVLCHAVFCCSCYSDVDADGLIDNVPTTPANHFQVGICLLIFIVTVQEDSAPSNRSVAVENTGYRA